MHISPSDKVYVGITSQKPEARWFNGRGYCYNTHFYNAILKYGWDNFQHIIVEENLSQEKACELEIDLIKKYKSNNPKYGYNHSTGGDLSAVGTVISEETRKKLSKASKGRKLSESAKEKVRIANSGPNNHHYGKHLSEEHRKHISDALRGKKYKKWSEESRKKLSENRKGTKQSEETKRKRSEALKGHKGYWEGKHFSEDHKEKLKGRPPWNKGKHFSEETKRKMSEAAMRRYKRDKDAI